MFRVPGLFLLVVTIGGAAHAATQSLALLETDEVTPLVCEGGVCKAEFSSYCLQKERPLPAQGDPYRTADISGITLVLTAADGTENRVPAEDRVRITAARGGHTAVTIALAEDMLNALGAQKAAVEIGERVALMPVAYTGDDNPQTEQDKALAAGPLRELGRRVVDRGPQDIDRVHVLNKLINSLPDDVDRRPDAKQSLWRQAEETGLRGIKPGRMTKAAEEYAACWQDRLVQMGAYSVRYCLQRRHDLLMWQHGQRYWDAAGAGS